MKLEINFEKKHAYFLGGLVILLTIGFFANAYGTNSPSVFGHSAGEIDFSESDPTVLESVKDGVSWNELSGIPAGFADGVDNIGGSLSCVTKSKVIEPAREGAVYCDEGYTMTGGGSIWRSDGNDQYVYSYPYNNGWYCANYDSIQNSCYVRCCKIN